MISEYFIPIKGEEGYEISNYGRIKSLRRVVQRNDGIKRTISERIMTPPKGDNNVCLGFKNSKRLRVLMACSFFSKYDSEKYVVKLNPDESFPLLNRIKIIHKKTRKEIKTQRISYNILKKLSNEDKKAYIWFVQNLE